MDFSDLTIFQGNVRSLNANFDSITEIFDNCQKLPNVLAITETKLKKYDDEPEKEGYEFERSDTTTDFGGVGIYLANHLDYTIRNDLNLEANYCEDIWIDIEMNQNKDKSVMNRSNLVIGVIYRHPGHKYDTFCHKLCQTLSILNASKTNYILVGDFNIDLIKFEHHVVLRRFEYCGSSSPHLNANSD